MTDRNRFRQRFYPSVSARQWNNWRWQMRNRIRDLKTLERLVVLTNDERDAIARCHTGLPMSITPYYASLMDRDDLADPIRRCMIPLSAEFNRVVGERDDPLGERAHSPVPGLVHTYPDKVLFLVTDYCATYCRYCTRSRLASAHERPPDGKQWQRGLDYIRAHPGVRDVLLSGGDPLVLSDERLDALLSELHEIPHVEFLRMGTKTPAVMPQRITPELVRMLRKYHPLYISIHFTHPVELTAETARACNRLADAGIPLGGQTVLLAGINDEPAVMKALMQGLLKLRVKPYYLHQCDAGEGLSHFRTSIEAGRDIIRQLHGHTTGYAVPTYMLDAPGGGGKVPLTPDYVISKDADGVRIRSYDGDIYTYVDGASSC